MQQFLHTIEQLSIIFADSNHQKVLLVTGNYSYEESGAKAAVDKLLRKHTVVTFNSLTPNPKLDEIKTLVQRYRDLNPDVVVAVGGGSVIDAAKAARLLAYQHGISEDLIKSNDIKSDPQSMFIAIPTTAGSGAESTHFAVIYVGKEKYSLAHPKALPDTVVLDPRLTASLSSHTTASTGMDAIAQAIEAYWSVKSTEASRSLCKRALALLLPTIERAVADPTIASRQAMLYGANLAGQAINTAFTTAPHALSYGFTMNFNIDHGEAVALTLPAFMRFNGSVTEHDCQDPRGTVFVSDRINEIAEILDAADITAASKKIEDLIHAIGLSRAIKLSNPKGAVETLTYAVNNDRLKNNPRIVARSDIQMILGQVIK